jgi:hypothetical protein
MLQSFKDNLSRLWQGRFRWGLGFSLFNSNFNLFKSGQVVIAFSLFTIASSGTGHWPWSLVDVAVQIGPQAAMHFGLLGFTFGRFRKQHFAEDGTIEAPDTMEWYFFFKGINHQQQTLEEIV